MDSYLGMEGVYTVYYLFPGRNVECQVIIVLIKTGMKNPTNDQIYTNKILILTHIE